MSIVRVDVRPEARLDLAEAVVWYAERDVERAVRFVKAFDDRLERIRRFPKSGEPFERGTRRLLLTGWPYQIIYRTVEDYFEVVAVSNTDRDQSYWKDRL